MENFGLIGNFAVSMDKPFVESISNDTLAQLPPGAFPGRIDVVDTTAAVDEACKTLAQQMYAATDAWIGRAIYMEFMKRRPAGVRMDEIARYDDSSAQGNASR